MRRLVITIKVERDWGIFLLVEISIWNRFVEFRSNSNEVTKWKYLKTWHNYEKQQINPIKTNDKVKSCVEEEKLRKKRNKKSILRIIEMIYLSFWL